MTTTLTASQQQQLDGTTPDRGMTLEVLRPADGVDCTLDGITSTHTRLTLVGIVDYRGGYRPSERRLSLLPPECRVWDASPAAPAVMLGVRRMGGIIFHLIPATWDGHHWTPSPEDIGHYCAGGNYATTGDSRVGDLLSNFLDDGRFYGALAVHDRLESYR